MIEQPPIPFTPEPMSSLKARYAAALRVTFDSDMILAGRQKRPGEMHANIFDTTGGIRLIVSREFHPDQPPESRAGIHISASFQPGGVDGDRLARIAERKGADAAYAELETIVLSIFRFISGDARRIVHIGISEGKGIPHWYIWEENSPTAP